MRDIQTTESRMQPEVDLANQLIDRCMRYIDKKYAGDPCPDLSRSRVLLGHNQRRALLYCWQAASCFTGERDDARLFDLQIVWVMKNDLAEFVEVDR